MNRRAVFVPLLVALVGLIVAGGSTGYAQNGAPLGAPQGSVRGGVYTNPQAGYSFTLPEAWLSHGYKWYEYWGTEAERRRPGAKYITNWVYTPQAPGQPEGTLLGIYVYDKVYWDNLASQPVALPGPVIASTANTTYVMFGPGGVPYPDGSVDKTTYESLALTVHQVRPALSVWGAAEALPPPTARPGTTGAIIGNPASQNCVNQGGVLSIETRSDGGQYGVCQFEDNRQCEEWALLRGECPVGGVKVTGYTTPAARYCAITGGQYAGTGNSNAANEQGTCTLKSGQQCDVWDYYNGKCSRTSAPAPSAPGLSIPTPTVSTYAAAILGGAQQLAFSSKGGGGGAIGDNGCGDAWRPPHESDQQSSRGPIPLLAAISAALGGLL